MAVQLIEDPAQLAPFPVEHKPVAVSAALDKLFAVSRDVNDYGVGSIIFSSGAADRLKRGIEMPEIPTRETGESQADFMTRLADVAHDRNVVRNTDVARGKVPTYLLAEVDHLVDHALNVMSARAYAASSALPHAKFMKASAKMSETSRDIAESGGMASDTPEDSVKAWLGYLNNNMQNITSLLPSCRTAENAAEIDKVERFADTIYTLATAPEPLVLNAQNEAVPASNMPIGGAGGGGPGSRF